MVGAGIAGASLAYMLLCQGLRVAVIEAGIAGGQGASALSGGIVRSYDPDPLLADLSAAGLALFQSWEALGLPGPSPYRASGCYWLSSGHIASATVAGSHMQYGRLDDFPALDFIDESRAAVNVLFEPGGGYGCPRAFCAQLVAECRRRGALVLEHTRVERISREGAGPLSVHCLASLLTTRQLALCTGSGLSAFLDIPESFSRSIPLLTVTSPDLQLKAPLIDTEHSTYFRPLNGQHFQCGSQRWAFLQESGPSPEEIREDALERLFAVLGRKVHVEVVSQGIAYDVYHSSFRPWIGHVDAEQQIMLASLYSGRGFKYALAGAVIGARKIMQALDKPYVWSAMDDHVSPRLENVFLPQSVVGLRHA
ncbi:MAG: FAD-dependent oxidoreductase [Moraxellaceae bacterium]|nr:FAD-dependent oxidoreductase [Moraxellaceae bacterium]